MDHITLKGATTQVTDQGVFEAVISTETADREKDVVSAAAMVAALKKWNRPLPLAWNHSTAAADIIGSVEPMTATVKDGEVVVQGQVDLDSEVGREAWRSFKRRTIGFSFGYLTIASTKREGGGRHLTEVDIFEITATPTPMNNDTRVLSTKSANHQRRVFELVTAGITEGTVEPGEPGEDTDAAPQTLSHMIDEDEYAGMATGELKAVWSTAYINDLPDSAFLYIEGGTKDDEGKTTPRSRRHFPVKDATGKVDLPHLRNALARIPQSNLPQSIKDRLTKKAEAMLENAKAVPPPPEPPPDPMDGHRTVYQVVAAEIPEPPPEPPVEDKPKAAPPPEPPPKPPPDPMVGHRKVYELVSAEIPPPPPEPTADEKAAALLGEAELDALVLGTISQSNLSQDVKDRLAAKAKAMLDKATIEDETDKDPPAGKSAAQDPPPNHDEQRRLYEMATEGIVESAPPPAKAVAPPELPPTRELRRDYYDVMLETLIGEEVSE